MFNYTLRISACVFALVMIVFTSFGQSNTGTIKGTVRTSDGAPADMVTLSIKNVASATADRNGEFTLKSIPQGDYTVTARLVGLNSVSKQVTVVAGQTTSLEIFLQASNEQLKEVVVSGGKTNKFSVKESEFVSKMPLKNLENPQVYTSVSKELIAEQLVTNFDDALKNVPGLDKLWSSTGRASDGAGYFSLRGFSVQPTLVNGLPGLTNGSLDVSNIERIEVLKGPSGTLFGSSLISYGGLINTVTKQPFDAVSTDVNYTAGSYGLNRVTVDVNTPLDQDHKVLLRVNAAYHDEDSFQDFGFKKTRFFAPSLSYKVNDKLSFLINAQFLSSEGTNPTMLFFDRASALKTTTLAGLNYDPKKSYTSNDLALKNPVTSIQAQMNYKISDRWNSQTVVSRGTSKSQGYYSYLYEDTLSAPGALSFGRSITSMNFISQTTDIQQNFVGDFHTGPLRHRLVAGLDYYNRTSIDNGSAYVSAGTVVLDAQGGSDSQLLTRQSIDALIAEGTYNSASKTTQEVYSAYASDVINFTPALSAMLSLRVDRFQNGGLTVADEAKFGQTAFSPKFGLVYQVFKDKLSVFGNYMNGFTNVAPVNVNDNNISRVVTFDPEHANQWETGVKTDLFDGKLTASLSYYDIRVSNIVLALGLNQYTQGGKNYSKGFEADINANPVPGFNIVAGYSRNSSKLTAGDADFEGRRSEGAGPKDLVNVWLSYKILNGSVKGLGFGFGGNYAGENVILNRATTGVFTLPSYTVLNASVNYTTGAFNFGVKLDNLTNKQYYKGWSTIEPMRLRTVVGSIGYHF